MPFEIISFWFSPEHHLIVVLQLWLPLMMIDQSFGVVRLHSFLHSYKSNRCLDIFLCKLHFSTLRVLPTAHLAKSFRCNAIPLIGCMPVTRAFNDEMHFIFPCLP